VFEDDGVAHRAWCLSALTALGVLIGRLRLRLFARTILFFLFSDGGDCGEPVLARLASDIPFGKQHLGQFD